jgi:hypothetical protein
MRKFKNRIIFILSIFIISCLDESQNITSIQIEQWNNELLREIKDRCGYENLDFKKFNPPMLSKTDEEKVFYNLYDDVNDKLERRKKMITHIFDFYKNAIADTIKTVEIHASNVSILYFLLPKTEEYIILEQNYPGTGAKLTYNLRSKHNSKRSFETIYRSKEWYFTENVDTCLIKNGINNIQVSCELSFKKDSLFISLKNLIVDGTN